MVSHLPLILLCVDAKEMGAMLHHVSRISAGCSCARSRSSCVHMTRDIISKLCRVPHEVTAVAGGTTNEELLGTCRLPWLRLGSPLAASPVK